jgi:hypothetical protein
VFPKSLTVQHRDDVSPSRLAQNTQLDAVSEQSDGIYKCKYFLRGEWMETKEVKEMRTVDYCISILKKNGLNVFAEFDNRIMTEADFLDRKTSGWRKKEWQAEKLENEWYKKLEPIADLIEFDYERNWDHGKLFYIWRIFVNTSNLNKIGVS